jgi:ATP-binding cassette subfamily B protein
MMLSISVIMTLVSFIILPFSILVVKKIVNKSQKYFKKQQEFLGDVNGKVEEIYGGHTIVKAFNGEEEAIQNFTKANQELYTAGWKSQFLSGLMHPLMRFLANLGYVAVSIIGGYLAVKGKITVGNIQSFIQYNKQFTHPINQIAQISGMLQAMIAAAERVFDFLEQPEEEETKNKNIDISKLKGNVEFKNVKFVYDEGKTIINDFSSKIKEGQKIAIVGPTGAR